MTVNVVAGESPNIRVPLRVTRSLAAFREWAGDNDLPEKTRVDYYKGEVWVDMSKEQVWTHGRLKTRISTALDTLAVQNGLGDYWCNGILLTHDAAELSCNPDGTFVSHEALASGRIRQVEGKEGGIVELEGTPDMVLEVVSDGSEKKDNQSLREAYWEAGIPEYWLVDARGEEIEFDILKRGPKGYTAAKRQAGWVKSAVFGKSFRLTRTTSAAGQPEFTLEVK
jgi:Uma2 family endonuclease